MGRNALYTVDFDTNTWNLVGFFGVTLNVISFDPVTRKLYGTSGDQKCGYDESAGPYALWEIDQTTAATTLVVGFGTGPVTSLAWSPNGKTLFGFTENGDHPMTFKTPDNPTFHWNAVDNGGIISSWAHGMCALSDTNVVYVQPGKGGTTQSAISTYNGQGRWILELHGLNRTIEQGRIRLDIPDQEILRVKYFLQDTGFKTYWISRGNCDTDMIYTGSNIQNNGLANYDPKNPVKDALVRSCFITQWDMSAAGADFSSMAVPWAYPKCGAIPADVPLMNYITPFPPSIELDAAGHIAPPTLLVAAASLLFMW
jgi:hypothetical protein